MDKKLKTITVRVTEEMKEKLTEHCWENDKSVSKVITRLIQEYLDRQF